MYYTCCRVLPVSSLFANSCANRYGNASDPSHSGISSHTMVSFVVLDFAWVLRLCVVAPDGERWDGGGSGGEHWARMVLVEVWQGTLGLMVVVEVRRGRGWSWLRSDRDQWSWLRSGREHWAWMVVVEVRQGTDGRG